MSLRRFARPFAALTLSLAATTGAACSVPAEDDVTDSEAAASVEQKDLAGAYLNDVDDKTLPEGAPTEITLGADGTFTATFKRACSSTNIGLCTTVKATGTYGAGTKVCPAGTKGACGLLQFKSVTGYQVIESDSQADISATQQGVPTREELETTVWKYVASTKTSCVEENPYQRGYTSEKLTRDMLKLTHNEDPSIVFQLTETTRLPTNPKCRYFSEDCTGPLVEPDPTNGIKLFACGDRSKVLRQ